MATVVFCSKRIGGEIPELNDIKNQFAGKYGTQYVTACADATTAGACGVHVLAIGKLAVAAPTKEARINALDKIAAKHGAKFDKKDFATRNNAKTDTSTTTTTNAQYADAGAAAFAARPDRRRRRNNLHPTNTRKRATLRLRRPGTTRLTAGLRLTVALICTVGHPEAPGSDRRLPGALGTLLGTETRNSLCSTETNNNLCSTEIRNSLPRAPRPLGLTCATFRFPWTKLWRISRTWGLRANRSGA